MAGGKLTPRQKMINLMYLVFIAMLAMNMSKEVLSAFGLMNEKFEGANSSAKATNEQMMLALDTKATEAKGEFAVAAATAHKVEAATKKFYSFVETLKAEVHKFCYDKVYHVAKSMLPKHDRSAAFDAIKEEFIATIPEEEREAKRKANATRIMDKAAQPEQPWMN